MIKPIHEELTEEKLCQMDVNDILYAELGGVGAMGNNGRIILCVLQEKTWLRFEISVFEKEALFEKVYTLVSDGVPVYSSPGKQGENCAFIYYYGGMGNDVYVNKRIKLEIHEGYFSFKKDNNTYLIQPSFEGIFDGIAHELRNPSPPWDFE
jgi:hypothetical protein